MPLNPPTIYSALTLRVIILLWSCGMVTPMPALLCTLLISLGADLWTALFSQRSRHTGWWGECEKDKFSHRMSPISCCCLRFCSQYRDRSEEPWRQSYTNKPAATSLTYLGLFFVFKECWLFKVPFIKVKFMEPTESPMVEKLRRN